MAEFPDNTTIAVIGMAGRFPGADGIERFWENLVAARDVRVTFSREELRENGVPEALVSGENYVNKGYVLDNPDKFDAGFWKYTPKEAEIIDPQQRLFLECAWEAFEDAGYAPGDQEKSVGVYASVTTSSYIQQDNSLFPENPVRFLDELLGNDKDYAATRVAYKLNLKGPAYSIQSACSSSLVGFAAACQALLDYQCDMALAGGASVSLPEKMGYLAGQDGALSRDGCCRAFDRDASGIAYGNGVGVVLLKRLDEAVADRDHIYGVVLGFAVNNDGADKVGFTAPSVHGQETVLSEALALSGVDPETITYIETHGAGTPLGDPMEIKALETVYGNRANPCFLGSVKANVGHLNSAAGIAGVIRTMLSLEKKIIPPVLHFQSVNPEIPLEKSRFRIPLQAEPWSALPRRAGISSFGLGGTNGHCIVEQAPERCVGGTARVFRPVVLSAHSRESLDDMSARLSGFLDAHPQADLDDIAFTLQKGRKALACRRLVVADSVGELKVSLRERRWLDGQPERDGCKVYFLFPGIGAQYPGMGRSLYEKEPVYRSAVEECAEKLSRLLGEDIREILYPPAGKEFRAAEKMNDLVFAFVSLFTTEYALARLWTHWGVEPAGCVGHSFGQYAAAVVAKVFSLNDALAVAVLRGRLMQKLAPGAMLLLFASEEKVLPLLHSSLSIAAVNGEKLCSVSGAEADVNDLQTRLKASGIHHQRVNASRAGHSSLMDPILGEFREFLSGIALRPPATPFLSNVSGTWITPEEATSAEYWTLHIRNTVRFHDNISAILEDASAVLLEVGPGKTLGTLAKRHAAAKTRPVVFSLPGAEEHDAANEERFLCEAYGRLFLGGVNPNWYAGDSGDRRGQRISLPTYPFRRQSHWSADAGGTGVRPRKGALASTMGKFMRKRENLDLWFALPQWERTFFPPPDTSRLRGVGLSLIFRDQSGIADALAFRLGELGLPVVLADAGATYEPPKNGNCRIRPGVEEDCRRLFRDLAAEYAHVNTIIHAFSVEQDSEVMRGPEAYERYSPLCWQSLAHIARSLAAAGMDAKPVALAVLSTQLQMVTGEETLAPEKAAILGPCRAIPNEFLHLVTRNIDISAPAPAERLSSGVIDSLIDDVAAMHRIQGDKDLLGNFAGTVAYRGQRRWEQRFSHSPAFDPGESRERLFKKGGVYLITGGFGGVAFALSRHLAAGWGARLALLGRTPLPPKETWNAWLDAHEPDDPVADRIRKVQELEDGGAQVLVLAADVADNAAMLAARDAIIERFGTIDGVFHAASAAASGMIQAQTDERAQAVIRTKMLGTLALENMLEGLAPDFLLLFSSLCSYTPPLGFSDYAAACASMDLYAQARRGRLPYRVVAVNWGYWEGIGIGTVLLPRMLEAAGEHIETQGILPEEGMRCIERILATPAEQVIVSTADYPSLVEELQRNSKDILKNYADFQGGKKTAERPRLAVAFTRPDNAVERVIALVWQEILGIEPVGVNDAFIELGGDSLHAIPMVGKLEAIFRAKVPIRALVTENTVRKLAAFLVDNESRPGLMMKMAELFIKVKTMPEEEVRRMLSGRTQ
jgi:acyl transferase domain-containing protein/acyl carrier protein